MGVQVPLRPPVLVSQRMTDRGDTTAARVARVAPWAAFDRVAATAGVSPKQLRQRLAATLSRGRCHDVVAEALATRDPHSRAVAAVDWRCPPSLTRVRLGHRGLPRNVAAPRGSASWAGRPLSQPAAHRFLIAAAAAKPDPAARERAGMHSGAPVAVLQRLASDSDPRVRRAVAGNSVCGPAAAAGLADDIELIVQIDVASNPACPSTVLGALFASGDFWLREALASNPSTPTPALARIASEDIDVASSSVQETVDATRDAARRTLAARLAERA